MVIAVVIALCAGGLAGWFIVRTQSKGAEQVLLSRLAEREQQTGILSAELAALREESAEKSRELQALMQRNVRAETIAEELQKSRQEISRQTEAAQQELKSTREQLSAEKELTARYAEQASRIPVLQQQIETLTASAKQLQQEKAVLEAKVAELTTSLAEQQKANAEKLQLLDDARKQMKAEFEVLAQQILDTKSVAFTQKNKENLDSILSPLKTQLEDFKKRVEETYDLESKDRVRLHHEITTLRDLNKRIGEEAENLTKALKGQSQKMGAWGEMILEKVLEESGLRKGHEYETQVTVRSEDGDTYRPDVIVHLPEEKDIVIDAKTSLVAYNDAVNAATEDERAVALSRHVASVRQHLKGLQEKEYEKLPEVTSLGFILMFIPLEGAFHAVLQHDPNLFGEAFRQNVMIVGPTTLYGTMKIIHGLWQYKHTNDNAQAIAEKAGNLYDKFASFAETLEALGKKIDGTKSDYEKAMNQLAGGKGNLIRRVEELKKMGVATKKQLTLPKGIVIEEDDEIIVSGE